VCYFCGFQEKPPKVNNHPMGENSANLVTLDGAKVVTMICRFEG
jgi:hypothetical protein